jgi:hypothetical protein
LPGNYGVCCVDVVVKKSRAGSCNYIERCSNQEKDGEPDLSERGIGGSTSF